MCGMAGEGGREGLEGREGGRAVPVVLAGSHAGFHFEDDPIDL